ncbi:MAG TPA: hypothetical protein VFN33_06410 [Gaiellaceae bacterium]|nr:hypothetical protein [Gaiellaceae bacterium]
MWKRLFGRGGDEATATKQEGDVHALDRPDDPRGGVQSDEYRHARPDDLVEDGEAAMGGPGGAPVEELGVEERRERDRPEEAEPR